MRTRRLNLLDMIWLNVDSAATPMHVGGLLTFQLPDDAPDDFCQQLVDWYRSHERVYAPWNRYLQPARLKGMGRQWQLLDSIDTEYHFRHSALPEPGGERELGILTSRLHGYALDMRRPPWECHLIEGLENNRFAIYLKAHHALVDSVRGMRLLFGALTEDAADRQQPPFWSIEKPQDDTPDVRHDPQPGLMRAAAELVGGARDQAASLPALVWGLRDMLRGARANADAAGAAFSSAATIFNVRVDARRRYATQLFSLSEFERLAANAGVTLNDMVLAVCAGGLRRYLRELGELPGKSLTAGVPVTVRPADATHEQEDALTFMVASLGTAVADAEQRLDIIAAATRQAREKLGRLSSSAITQHTVAMMAPHILSSLTGMSGRMRPVCNVAISYVPGPDKPLYARGAPLEAIYPTSFVTHGQALNITVHGYCDTLGFGFIGCGETLPSLQRLAVHTGEALDELRQLFACKPCMNSPEAP